MWLKIYKSSQILTLLACSFVATSSFADCPDLTDKEMENIICVNRDVVDLSKERTFYRCSFYGSKIYQSQVRELSLKDLIKARGGNITIKKSKKTYLAHKPQCEYDRKDDIMMFHYEKPAPGN